MAQRFRMRHYNRFPGSPRECSDNIIVTETMSFRSVVRAGSARVDPEKNCEGWFAEDELDVLRRYFARHVYRDGLTFWEWCIPRMLATIERSRIRSDPKCPAQSVERLFKKLRAKGVIG
jgi:hypothetical protein